MYEQLIPEDFLFYMLYGGVAAMALAASVYLLFRQGNAFAPDVTPPLRLRYWTAALFIFIALSHMWYLPVAFFTSSKDIERIYLVGELLDCMTIVPLTVVVQFAMLQDRRRPLWPIGVAMMPLVTGLVLCLFGHGRTLIPALYAYAVLMGIILVVYMVGAVRQYGQWLRDNYADLEHKEVRQSLVVLAVILLVLGVYVFGYELPGYEYGINLNSIVLIGYLLWRVETLSDLSAPAAQSLAADEAAPGGAEDALSTKALSSTPAAESIGPLLQAHCIDERLYLQHDLTLLQLAKVIGVNRFYLSQYFSGQGVTYNAYINDLRIRHFVSLYREVVAAQRPFTVQQLARESGYRSYSTFSLAFKQRMGQTVTAWMREATP
ncbi:MAG: helix-turn-helix transcriptional regulator [Bacteroidaceae bacterium]|nr:helix-turn-helix transcriptional regulator [Bacteroidaceae bacterium]